MAVTPGAFSNWYLATQDVLFFLFLLLMNEAKIIQRRKE